MEHLSKISDQTDLSGLFYFHVCFTDSSATGSCWMECNRWIFFFFCVYTTNTNLDKYVPRHAENTYMSHLFKQRSSNIHVHIADLSSMSWKKKCACVCLCVYLELHDEMCEVEFSLQVQSDTDALLSCGGNDNVNQCHDNTTDACLLGSPSNITHRRTNLFITSHKHTHMHAPLTDCHQVCSPDRSAR